MLELGRKDGTVVGIVVGVSAVSSSLGCGVISAVGVVGWDVIGCIVVGSVVFVDASVGFHVGIDDGKVEMPDVGCIVTVGKLSLSVGEMVGNSDGRSSFLLLLSTKKSIFIPFKSRTSSTAPNNCETAILTESVKYSLDVKAGRGSIMELPSVVATDGTLIVVRVSVDASRSPEK